MGGGPARARSGMMRVPPRVRSQRGSPTRTCERVELVRSSPIRRRGAVKELGRAGRGRQERVPSDARPAMPDARRGVFYKACPKSVPASARQAWGPSLRPILAAPAPLGQDRRGPRSSVRGDVVPALSHPHRVAPGSRGEDRRGRRSSVRGDLVPALSHRVASGSRGVVSHETGPNSHSTVARPRWLFTPRLHFFRSGGIEPLHSRDAPPMRPRSGTDVLDAACLKRHARSFSLRPHARASRVARSITRDAPAIGRHDTRRVLKSGAETLAARRAGRGENGTQRVCPKRHARSLSLRPHARASTVARSITRGASAIGRHDTRRLLKSGAETLAARRVGRGENGTQRGAPCLTRRRRANLRTCPKHHIGGEHLAWQVSRREGPVLAASGPPHPVLPQPRAPGSAGVSRSIPDRPMSPDRPAPRSVPTMPSDRLGFHVRVSMSR